MKYKNELRWLIFLLVPFILMLAILILAPLQIITHSHPLATNSYSINQLHLSENQLRSTTIINTKVLQNIFQKYLDFIHIFSYFKKQQNSFYINQPLNMSSTIEVISTINNQSSGQNYSTINLTSSTTKYDDLSAERRKSISSYLKKQMLLKSFSSNNKNDVLSCISEMVFTQNQTVYYYVPIQEQLLCSFSAFQSQLHQNIINSIKQKNQIQPVLAFIRRQDGLNKSFLIICEPSDIDNLISIPCIHLDVSKLAEEINQATYFLFDDIITNAYLLMDFNQIYASNQTKPSIIFEFNNGTFFPQQSNQILNTSNQFGSYDFSSRQYQIQDSLTFIRNESFSSFLSPMAIYNQKNTSIITFLSNNQINMQNVPLFTFQEQSNVLIIVIVVFVVVGSLVSACILKILLDTMDRQLYTIEDYTKFIIGGDVNIQIPSFNGTEDVKEIYEKIRIINKLHRYSTNSYFTGHFAEKILKYNEALQFLTGLGYDVGHVLDNMGEAYTYIQQWDKSINSYKRSLDIAFRQLKERFNLTMDDVLALKKERKALPAGYRQFQVILLKRMFKLSFTYLKYLELRPIFTKEDKAQVSFQQAEFKKKLDRLSKESAQNMRLLKIAFYPDFHKYGECVIALISETKQLLNLKNIEQAKKLMETATKILNIYGEEYAETTKKLKQKGSKYKLLHQKNKLTPHSRANPQILRMFRNLFQTKILTVTDPTPNKFIQIAKLLTDGIKIGNTTIGIGYMVAIQLRRLLVSLKIDPAKYESTQLFRQFVPFKTLYSGEITKDIQPQLLKFPTKASLGLERQFIFIFDCARPLAKNEEKLMEYFKQRTSYIFEKLIKKTDRLSIIKYNMKNGIKIQCSLILKQSNEQILRKQISSSLLQQNQSKGRFQQLVQVLYKAVNRIKGLQSDKVIMMFFKSLDHYSRISERRSRRKKKTQFSMNTSRMEDEDQQVNMNQFGQYVIEALKMEKLKNCKLILYCSNEDSVQQFRNFFGLQNVNNRIWNGYNYKNNVVYIIQEKHKIDIDRILMLKTQDIPDNHSFIL